MLLMPRTGSTFCEGVISRAMPTAMMHSTSCNQIIGGFTKHNYRGAMPVEYKDHQVVGVKRDVLDLWASWYFYGMWSELFRDRIESGWAWPFNILFEEYYEGVESDGRKIIKADDSGGFAGDFYNAMFADSFGNVEDVRFLDFAKLDLEIYHLLKNYGHDDRRILVEPPMNANLLRHGQPWKCVINKETAESILESEKNGILNKGDDS